MIQSQREQRSWFSLWLDLVTEYMLEYCLIMFQDTVSPPCQLVKFCPALPRLEFQTLDFVWGSLSGLVPATQHPFIWSIHLIHLVYPHLINLVYPHLIHLVYPHLIHRSLWFCACNKNIPSFTFDLPTSPPPTGNPAQCWSVPRQKPSPHGTCEVTRRHGGLL